MSKAAWRDGAIAATQRALYHHILEKQGGGSMIEARHVGIDPGTTSTSTNKTSAIARVGFISAVAVAAVAILAGPAYRLGVPLNIAFLGLTIGAVGSIAAAVLCLIGAVVASPSKGLAGRNRALAGLLLSVLVAGFIWSLYDTARSVPPIHDITTDTANPPPFQAVLANRDAGTNSPLYAGEEIARQQAQAYPDIRPLSLALPPAEALALAERAARSLKWDIVAIDPGAGRLEATDTTLWFGFKDDVVVRVQPSESGTVLDIRSASRVGVSDVGANAARIRRFFAVMHDLD